MPDVERVEIEDSNELWDWLRAHHDRADSVLLVTYKKSDPARYVSRDEVRDALVAHGWVDGRRYVLDDDRTMQLISPRRQQRWAATYLDRFARLEREGRVHPAGTSALERARASARDAAGNVAVARTIERLAGPAR